MKTEDVLVGVLVLVCFICSCAEGLVHCHCNSPACVSSGYMCLSTSGHCYSLYSRDRKWAMASYGCLDQLDSPLTCRSRDVINREETLTEDLLLCCDDDMCNHLTERDAAVVKTLKRGAEDSEPSFGKPENYEPDSSAVWFKASVIGVPISGSFILILLILLAFRMLNSDKKRQSRLLQLRTEQSLAKAQLYVSGHFHNNKSSYKSCNKSPCNDKSCQGCNEAKDQILAPGFSNLQGSIV